MKEFEPKNLYSIQGRPGVYRFVMRVNGNNLVFERLIDESQKVLATVQSGKIVHFANIVVYTHGGQVPLEQVLENLYELKKSGEIPDDFDKLSEDDRALFMEKAVPGYDSSQFRQYHMSKILKWFSEISKGLDMLTEGIEDPYEKEENKNETDDNTGKN